MTNVTTIAGYVQISEQLLERYRLRLGYINHREVKSQRTRRAAYKRFARQRWFYRAMFPTAHIRGMKGLHERAA